MVAIRFSRDLITAFAVFALTGSSADLAMAGDAIVPTGTTDLLAPHDELVAINLTIVDEKLALSLAVETQIQINLTESALKAIRDDGLRQLTERKLCLLRQLHNTLEALTGGRASKLLGAAARDRRTAPSTIAHDPSPPIEQQLTSTTKRQDSSVHRATPAMKKGGGIGSILQNTATTAVLRVRLEIAEEFAELLRAELEAIPPMHFDLHYLRLEAYNQMQGLAMLRVFEQQASDEFARILHVVTANAEAQFLETRRIEVSLKAAPVMQPADNPLVQSIEPLRP